MLFRSANRVLNTSLVFSPLGEVVSRYDKIHLFGFDMGDEYYREDKLIEAGSDIVTVDSPFGKIGIAICYDLRFPELFRAMKEIDLLVIPSAFTETTGKVHWEILIRARAIENQCYVLASAQGGKHENERRTWGQSMLINPWGEIESELKDGEGFVMGRLKKDFIHETRTKLPALKHRTL